MRIKPRDRFVVQSLPDGRVLRWAKFHDVRVLRMSHLTDHPMAFIFTLRETWFLLVTSGPFVERHGLLSHLILPLEHQNGINSSQPSLWLSTLSFF